MKSMIKKEEPLDIKTQIEYNKLCAKKQFSSGGKYEKNYKHQ
jgi:hypothetical protein